MKTYAIKVKASAEPLLVRAVTITEAGGFLEFKNERGDIVEKFYRADVEGWWESPQHSKPPHE